MNLINNANTHTISKFTRAIRDFGLTACFKLFTPIVFFAMCIAASANGYEQDIEFHNTRSVTVNYDGKTPAAYTSRNAREKNDAQVAAIGAVNLLAHAPLQRKSREQVIAERKDKLPNKNAASNKFSSQSLHSGNYVTFTIYEVSNRLFDDFDYDGFYQTFSVSFDADVHSTYSPARAQVFADLYLSRNGGPWELYFTTEDFTIVDDSSEDKFEVLTSLDLGFRTAHYDILIDLYEVAYSDIVATISSEDAEALYALPLESADRDEYEEAGSHTSHLVIRGGSVSIFGLLLLVSALGLRFVNRFKIFKS